MMIENNAESIKTTEFLRPAKEPDGLVYEKRKVIGAPVKVRRTGRDDPDEGWHITDISFSKDKKNVTRTFVKVSKPDEEEPNTVLKKTVPLENLEKLNPEIKSMIFELDKNFVLYEDKDESFKIGLIIDMNLEDESLVVMLDPEAGDTTAPLDRIKIENIIDKNNDPKKLEETFLKEVKKRRAALSDEDLEPSKKTRISERKNLVYYLKITDTSANKSIGYAVDISKQGFMMTTGTPVESDALFQLKMLLPEEIQGDRYFKFSAMSRWCRQDQEPEKYNVGFQFADLSPEKVEIVNHIVEKYCY